MMKPVWHLHVLNDQGILSCLSLPGAYPVQVSFQQNEKSDGSKGGKPAPGMVFLNIVRRLRACHCV